MRVVSQFYNAVQGVGNRSIFAWTFTRSTRKFDETSAVGYNNVSSITWKYNGVFFHEKLDGAKARPSYIYDPPVDIQSPRHRGRFDP